MMQQLVLAVRFVCELRVYIPRQLTAYPCSQSVLVLLKGLAALGDKAFVRVVQDICKMSGVSFFSLGLAVLCLHGLTL